MALAKEAKSKIVKKYQRKATDTGSADVQVALLTARINELTGHLKQNTKDKHSQYGLIKLVSQRKKLLAYLQKHDKPKYEKLIADLGVRK